MTEQEPIDFTSDVSNTPIFEEANSQPDWSLTSLVRVVETVKGLEIGVVLHLAGLVISGSLLSGEKYFELLAKSAEASAANDRDSPALLALAAHFREISKSYVHARDLPDSSIAYVHLRAASVYAPGAAYALPETLWRGRLSHVSGWSLGSYSNQNDSK